MFIRIPPPIVPGIQDKNSNLDNECLSAKFETFLSKAEVPAIIVFLSNKDKCEKNFPNLIIIPLNPPSLINIFEPAPITLTLLNPLILRKKKIIRLNCLA